MATATPTQPKPQPTGGRHRADPRTPHAPNQAKNIPGVARGGTSHRK